MVVVSVWEAVSRQLSAKNKERRAIGALACIRSWAKSCVFSRLAEN
jgi:hypothetical protein